MWLRTDPYVAYKASKSGVVAFTEQLACALFWSLLRWLALLNDDSPSLADTLAADKIRANVILPGLMDTPVGNKRCCGSFAHKVSRKLLLADGSRHESEGVWAAAGGGGGRYPNATQPTVSRPFYARFAPFFRRPFALPGFLAPRRRERAKNGEK